MQLLLISFILNPNLFTNNLCIGCCTFRKLFQITRPLLSYCVYPSRQRDQSEHPAFRDARHYCFALIGFRPINSKRDSPRCSVRPAPHLLAVLQCKTDFLTDSFLWNHSKNVVVIQSEFKFWHFCNLLKKVTWYSLCYFVFHTFVGFIGNSFFEKTRFVFKRT